MRRSEGPGAIVAGESLSGPAAPEPHGSGLEILLAEARDGSREAIGGTG
jgi:hypothetical protein